MADKLFIKHNLGSFQQPYIFQAPANNRLPFIRQTPAPYPYIANKQEPNIRQQPAPYPYIANNQEPNIRQQPAPYTYSASQQEPNIRRTPAPYPYIANRQNPFIRHQPAPYPYIANAQTPNIRRQPAPYPYIANNQEPNIRRTPAPYPYIANAQQPNDRQQPAPYPYIANAQTPNIRQTPAPYPYIANAQSPNIRQQPATYTYPASQQEPNIRDAQQPVIRDKQEPNIRQTLAPYPYIADAQNPFIRQTPAPYPYIADAQNPFIRNAQTPLIGNTQQPVIGQTTSSVQGITQAPYSFQQPHIVQENFEWNSSQTQGVYNTAQTKTTLSANDFSTSVGFEVILSYNATSNACGIFVREVSSYSYSSGYHFRDEDGNVSNLSPSSNTLVGTITFPFDPDGVRLVIASASHTGNVTSAGWFPQSAVNSSNSLHSNTVVGGGALSNTSIPFASFGATGTYGARISGSHSLQASVIGNYSSQLDGDFYVQFSETGFSNFTHSYALPIRSSLMYNYTTGGGTPNPGIPQ